MEAEEFRLSAPPAAPAPEERALDAYCQSTWATLSVHHKPGEPCWHKARFLVRGAGINLKCCKTHMAQVSALLGRKGQAVKVTDLKGVKDAA